MIGVNLKNTDSGKISLSFYAEFHFKTSKAFFSAICTPKNAIRSELLYITKNITYDAIEQGRYGLCLPDGAEEP